MLYIGLAVRLYKCLHYNTYLVSLFRCFIDASDLSTQKDMDITTSLPTQSSVQETSNSHKGQLVEIAISHATLFS